MSEDSLYNASTGKQHKESAEELTDCVKEYTD